MGERLFVAQFVVAVEDQWFALGRNRPPSRTERQYFVETHLFSAVDAEAAYRVACEWLPGFEDANHDGPGDLTKIFALGIHDLEQLLPAPNELAAAVRETYGVDAGRYDPRAVDPAGAPLVRNKAELGIFQYPSR